MRVLGIDPSSRATGFGVIEYDEAAASVLSHGTIRPAARLPLYRKLGEIKIRLDEIIDAYEPEDVAVENPFYAQNIKTAITLGQVRGAILVSVASHGCSLYEYSPLEIKKAVTGYGQAEKGQVNVMVRALLRLQELDLEPDASDALATAYCHLNVRLFQKKLKESGFEEGR